MKKTPLNEPESLAVDPRAVWMREMGVEVLWRLRSDTAPAATVSANPSEPSSAIPFASASEMPGLETPVALPVTLPTPLSIHREYSPMDESAWMELQATVANCQRCALAKTRRHTVFGTGQRPAQWMMIGEGPGADEDATGKPFVGQAGKLLDQMLNAIGLNREQGVFIANVVKCRPPGNRNPAPEEIAACQDYLIAQIQAIQPKLLILLGKVAAQALLNSKATIGSMRGHIHLVDVPASGNMPAWQVPALVTYHPAYLLRNMPDKAKSWVDLQFALDAHKPKI